ncbi:hypothetical protein OIDMADRAFT_48820 [Oidiodendron maius Zn]|uniref:Uncharacterized protein n=1 Tax=Oidiodendron maius (strain Zn) TaxID=913774 RepID=A0A0C3E3N9_OIDMZ|nr:hypothetical protein OIDMADRAFT_48820 [Oidiodendron maius Zn]
MSLASSINFGNGLVEVAAVTTIIGSTTAESLILGSRGAAGLPWAAMSFFGCLHIVKCSLTASTPVTWRESLGLSATECDRILGVYSWSKALSPHRQPVGVVSMSRGASRNKPPWREIGFIYQFDEYTKNIIRSCPLIKDNSTPIFKFTTGAPERAAKKKLVVLDWLAIVLSLIKCAEFAVLLSQGSFRLAVSSTASWLLFFLAALILQALGLSRECSSSNLDNNIDILTGDLPSIQKLGSNMKILLDAPMNVRSHVAWRIVWFLGCCVSCVSLFLVCFFLSDETVEVFYIWISFQALWLLLRIVFYHYAHKTDDVQHVAVRWMPPYPGPRLLSLVMALSQYQMLRHPRGVSSYSRDEQSATRIEEMVRMSIWIHTPLSVDSKMRFGSGPNLEMLRRMGTVNVESVIGDTVLSAFAWVYELSLDDMDMYDSCLVVFSVQRSQYLVPSVRVMSGNISQLRSSSLDKEAFVSNVPGMVQRLGPNERGDNGWVFWIPLGPNTWLHLICHMNFLGSQHIEILDDAEVTRRLQLGTLGVSLARVEDIREVLQNSARVGQVMVESITA